MSTYQAPLKEFQLLLETVAPIAELSKLSHFADATPDTVTAILEESAKFATEVLDPLNWPGDQEGAKHNAADNSVTTPKGFKSAYVGYRNMGGTGLPMPVDFGGMGMPRSVVTLTDEMLHSANMGFGLLPMLTQGAIEAILLAGSDELKATFAAKMVSGEWTGTMNLTEPQAGSDLSLVKTRAEPQPDGTYKIFGTKIYITYGEHDWANNIIHLVLARLPDAPPGVKGISLLVVPKFLVSNDGSLGARNDAKCISIEHKLGIHASPTCTMKFGEQGGAEGYLVGEENRGLMTMFIMMNAARLAVGVQGVAIAERATQRAIDYANERKQGRPPGASGTGMRPIIEHADTRRSIMTMKAMTQAARAICLVTAREIDIAHRGGTEAERASAQAKAALLTPIAKAFSTDIGCEVASMGVQIHGGMGLVEETGAAQYYRDARILPIYEGTNGIQAIDLVTRKLPLGGGKVMEAYLAELQATVEHVKASNQPAFGRMGQRLGEAVSALTEATVWMGKALATNQNAALAGATPYLRLFGIAAGGHYLARGALAAARDGDGVPHIALARFFAENLCVQAQGLADTVTGGADSILSVAPDRLSA